MGPRNTRNARARRHRRGTERAPLPERRGWFIFCNQKNTVLVPSWKQARSELTEKTASEELRVFSISVLADCACTAFCFFFIQTRQGALLTRFVRPTGEFPTCPFRGVGRSRATRARPTQTVVFAFARARARRAVSRSRAPRVASRPARRLSPSAARRKRWRTFVTCRRSPSPRPRWRARRGGAPRCRTRRTSPSARSEGCWRRAFRVRRRFTVARARPRRLPSPPPSRTHPFFCRLEHLRASGSVAPPEDVRAAVHAVHAVVRETLDH